MNIRKNVDYTELFTALCSAVDTQQSQMELYCEIGRLVSARKEKGAAVAAADYLAGRYPEASGFSPRNLRRMREFYRLYENIPEILQQAMRIGWTQNVVIMEANLSLQDKRWYIQAVQRFGWSKAELLRRIESDAHTEMTLDTADEMCYTDSENTVSENENHDEDTFCLSREHMSESDGGICNERFGAESQTFRAVSYRFCRYQYRGTWQSGLPPGPPETGRAWHWLCGKNGPITPKKRLHRLRSPDRNGWCQSPKYAPDLRRRPGGQAPSAPGLYRPSQGCGRSVVYR